MVKHIAVALEYKQHGHPARQGPGDALRLAHGVRHPSRRDSPIAVLTSPDHRLDGLIPSATFVITPTSESSAPTGHCRFDDLAARLLDAFGSALDGALILHTFIGLEQTYPWNGVPWTLTPVSATRRRIDSSSPARSLLFWSRWNPPAVPRSNSRVLAIFVRTVSTSPKRNTPDWFPSICRGAAAAAGYSLLWFGDTAALDVQPEEQVFAPGRMTFLEQIRALRSTAAAAVGWNSGGLDLAAAAGLPVLRIGEFQAGGPVCEPPDVRRTHSWGPLYNSYLACATNIGLAPCYLDADRFPIDVLTRSLAAFLAHREKLSTPRHVIIPAGLTLASQWDRLDQQLSVHQVPWPGS